jgi:hypothetical protein
VDCGPCITCESSVSAPGQAALLIMNQGKDGRAIDARAPEGFGVGVLGESVGGPGMVASSISGTGLTAKSGSNHGVFAWSDTENGVFGLGAVGVFGQGFKPSGINVRGIGVAW